MVQNGWSLIMNRKIRSTNNYEVAAVRKALELLCSFSVDNPGLTVTDLSRCLQIPKSTTHNLLRTLQGLDFLTQNPEDKRYRLGPRVFELGLLFSHNTQLVRGALPHLRRLGDQTKETVKLAVLSNGEVLVLAALESPYQLHTRGDEGHRAPAHCSSLGKAILALLSASEIREIVAQRGLARFTARTITTLSRLEQELSQIRANGYAVDWEETEEGVRCVGARVSDPSVHIVAAISVSGPVSRITDKRIRKLAGQVTEAAKAISASLAERVVGKEVGARIGAR